MNGRCIHCREPHREFGAFTGAVARDADCAAMELHEPPHERQPEAEAALAMELAFCLVEKLEYALELGFRKPDAVVANAEYGVVAFALQRNVDAAARGSVGERVREQVHDHL